MTQSYLRRAALAACPRSDRPWLEALLGEAAAIDGTGPRLIWLVGAAQLVLTTNLDRLADQLVRHLYVALAAALAVATSAGAFSRSGYESLGDDDLFIGLALAASAAALALLALGLTRSSGLGRPSSGPG